QRDGGRADVLRRRARCPLQEGATPRVHRRDTQGCVREDPAPITQGSARLFEIGLERPFRLLGRTQSMAQQVGGLNTVRALALALPDVKENVTKLGTGWKVKGKLMACQAIHKSAESDSIMVRISTEERERLIKAQPDIYY